MNEGVGLDYVTQYDIGAKNALLPVRLPVSHAKTSHCSSLFSSILSGH